MIDQQVKGNKFKKVLFCFKVQTVAQEYHQWRCQQYQIAHPNWETSWTTTMQFLAYLARGGYFHQVALSHGVAKSTLMVHVKNIAQFFAQTASQYIMLPQPPEFPYLSSPLHDASNQTQYQVIGYIDGFIVKIQRPDYAGDAYFCGRHGKSCDSLNVQYITDKDGHVKHIITGQ